MRFCVSGRQPYSVIKRADEVKFNYNDKDKILDLVEKYPDKTVILVTHRKAALDICNKVFHVADGVVSAE